MIGCSTHKTLNVSTLPPGSNLAVKETEHTWIQCQQIMNACSVELHHAPLRQQQSISLASAVRGTDRLWLMLLEDIQRPKVQRRRGGSFSGAAVRAIVSILLCAPVLAFALRAAPHALAQAGDAAATLGLEAGQRVKDGALRQGCEWM